MMMTYERFINLVKEDLRFADFRLLFQHEPLQRFVYAEKCILGELSETRIFCHGEIEGGIAHSTQVVLDEYYGVFIPFQIKAVWLPLSAGRSYSILGSDEACPILSRRNGEEECLFFIHPNTESLYAELLTRYEANSMTLSAFSLSSPRSLLVALPDATGKMQAVMVKVSLNQKAHEVLRLLSDRECALSVANTSIFSRILKEDSRVQLSIFEDPFAFVPEGYDFGMSYRRLPEILNPEHESQATYLIPLLSFYGQANADFFKMVVLANGNCITAFLTTLFKRYIPAYLTLLLNHNLSIEAHGQNLLLVLDHTFQFKGVMYRDMGGVNTQIDAADSALPHNLRHPELSYYENHVVDAAKALEHLLVWRGLYPLTKQLVKHGKHFQKTDAQFSDWYQACSEMPGVLGNWTDGIDASDRHHEHLDIAAFYRYGYVETLFGHLLLAALTEKQILAPEILERFITRLFSPEQLSETLIVAPCTFKTFFDDLITTTLNSRSLKR